MRNALATVAVFFCSFCHAQTTENRTAQDAVQTPGNTAPAQDPARPQQQMPPDGKAPAPTPSAQSLPNSDLPSTGPSISAWSGPRSLVAGTDIRATLDTPLSTRTSKRGDRFAATISAPIHDASGNIVVPVGSKLNGQIGEPADDKLKNAIKDMGHLNLRFTDIQLPNGVDVPLDATLLSVHNGKAGRPTPAGTAIGNPGLAGFGPPLKGLAVGNLQGGGYVLATTAKHVELPAECGLRLRVNRTTPLP